MKKRKTILRLCIIGIVICLILHSFTTQILRYHSKRRIQDVTVLPSEVLINDPVIHNKIQYLKVINKTTPKQEVRSKTQNVTIFTETRNPIQITNTSTIQYISTTIPTKLSPVNHIAFLKVHKSASSTAQNIFLRYGFTRGLHFVLPIIPNKTWPNIISTTTTLNSKNIMPPPNNGSFDILCCHVIYNYKAFRQTMPKDTVYIGIVREPFDHFQSVLRYFRPQYIYRINTKNRVSEYLRHPWVYEPKYTSPYLSFTNNRMALEFGLPVHILNSRNKTDIQNYLNKLSREFLLVLVVEYFDESILLMKRLLGWELKDILYIKRNVSPRLNEWYMRQPGDRDRYQYWASIDYALYDFFFAKLMEQIQQQGPSFYDELLYFKRIRNRIEDFCVSGDLKNVFVVNHSIWNEKFYINNFDCNIMLLQEMKFVQYLQAVQYPNVNVTPVNTVQPSQFASTVQSSTVSY